MVGLPVTPAAIVECFVKDITVLEIVFDISRSTEDMRVQRCRRTAVMLLPQVEYGMALRCRRRFGGIVITLAWRDIAGELADAIAAGHLIANIDGEHWRH